MSLFDKFNLGGDERGHCKGCRWWQAEADPAASADGVIGLCMQPELTHFSVQVSGNSGCNRYECAAEGADLIGATGG
jgi:hypothetical protein